MSRDRDRARPDTRLSSSDNESDDEDYQLPHSHPEYGSDSSDQDFELNNVGNFVLYHGNPMSLGYVRIQTNYFDVLFDVD